MSTIVTRALQLVFFLSLASSSFAAEIEGSCMVSFNVKDKTFFSGATTMSCTALESRRLSLFTQVSSLPKSGNLDIASTTKALADLEDRLKQLESDTNWTGLGTSITGNALATVGLSACVETSGAGCAVAVIAKLLSLVGIVSGAASDAAKAKEVDSVRAAISAIRLKINNATTPAATIRDRLVAESNGICADVKKFCLN